MSSSSRRPGSGPDQVEKPRPRVARDALERQRESLARERIVEGDETLAELDRMLERIREQKGQAASAVRRLGPTPALRGWSVAARELEARVVQVRSDYYFLLHDTAHQRAPDEALRVRANAAAASAREGLPEASARLATTELQATADRVQVALDAALEDPSGRALDRVLSATGLEPTPEGRAALHHVYTREPKGDDPAWRPAAERDPLQLRGWFHKAVAAERRRQEGWETHTKGGEKLQRLSIEALDFELAFAAAHSLDREGEDQELEDLLDLAGLTPRERDVARERVNSSSLEGAATRLEIAASTARVLFSRVRKKISALP